ncbi:Hvo_1808 family surface protein [Haloarchaeobius amylolyticus]|uniref:Hvo_1808 family surface protein n=1 Tax=Haloarchaeobius amylolyticus TaxID=1198296 RepID=UPI00226E2CB6|nr:Hvo_1808 family surface protein [Haloarchaeobius amylolyticus]
MRRGLCVLGLVFLLALAGCSAFDLGGDDELAEPESNRPDPATDTLGWEDGYWWNDSVAVDGSDGLTQAEVAVVKARMMARLEHLRGYEFERDVSVRVISRETYREQRSGGGGDGQAPAWREQYWEALFIVGEDTGVEAAFDRLYGSTVIGYYSNDKIVLVSDDPNDLRVSRATLAHELEHALQDQHLGLGYSASTRDGRLAAQSVVEGDANYVEARYEDSCESGEWDCVTVAERSGGGRSAEYNVGLSVASFLPYGEGPMFVSALRERGGWDAVDAAFTDHPQSTAQVIHPAKYPDEAPAAVSIPDRASGGWSRLETEDGTDRVETVGEASIYTMFWYAKVVPREHLTSRNDSVSKYTYRHPFSTGWAGDRLVFYEDGDNQAYVWQSTWESRAEATEFRQAYTDVLAANDATARGDGVYVIDSGAFEDAFRVVQRGNTVLVVNAPSVDALDAVHPVSAGANASVGTERRPARSPTA